MKVKIEKEVVEKACIYHALNIVNYYQEATGKKESIITDEILDYFDKYYDELPDGLQFSINWLRGH